MNETIKQLARHWQEYKKEAYELASKVVYGHGEGPDNNGMVISVYHFLDYLVEIYLKEEK